MQIDLSILICTLENRRPLFKRLEDELFKQRAELGLEKNIQILPKEDNGEMSIGDKRNWLLDRAQGEYLCFIDDDDWIDSEYIKKIYEAIQSKPSCVMMIGVMNTDGRNKQRFEHSIRFWTYYSQSDIFFRPPNHLNPIRSDIARRFKFPESNHGEDTDWAMQIRQSGLLKTEEAIDKPIYHYRYTSKK